jgi:outer membrane protein OmpA-like peptidoglycan-associated protein
MARFAAPTAPGRATGPPGQRGHWPTRQASESPLLRPQRSSGNLALLRMLDRPVGVIRRCSGGVECAPCEAERLGVQGQATGAAAAGEVPASVGETLREPGQPLDSAARAMFEPRFGHDFGDVRVHTGALASASARGVAARAYTAGRHIVFGAGAYAPAGHEGRRLLAHELAHVVQQRATAGAVPTQLGRTDDPAEREAEAAASSVVDAGRPVSKPWTKAAPKPKKLSHPVQQGASPRRANLARPAGELPQRAGPAGTLVIARKDGPTSGASHKANDPNQLKSELHPTGKAHLYADQVASIYFGTKSYVPDQDDHKTLKALAEEYLYTARRRGELRGKVIGHADVEMSSDPDNQELSFQRARWTAAAFKSYIAAAALSPDNLQFETEGAGTGFCMGDPACKGKVGPDALAQYRRADIIIFTEKMPSPQVSSCPPASGAGVTTLGEYIELVRCAEVKTGLDPRTMLALLRQMYYGKPWSATTQDPNWNFVIPCSPNIGDPKDKLGQPLFDALHNTVTIEGTDLGHVFAGLEAMTCPASSVTVEISKFGMVVVELPFDLSNESFATWGGDLGSVAGVFVACWMMTDQERATKGKDKCHQGSMPESLEQYFVKPWAAPPADLEGDIAPFVIRAAERGACGGSLEQRFTPQAPISQIFTNFFYNRGPAGTTSRDRYQCFAEAIGASVINGKIANRAALIDKYQPGVLSFARAYYVQFKKEIPRSDPVVPLLDSKSTAVLHLFFDWLQARMRP